MAPKLLLLVQEYAPALLLFAFLAAAVLAVRSVAFSLRISRHFRRVPRPAGWVPLLGHALQLAGARPWRVMQQWCVTLGDSNVVHFQVLGSQVLYISSPALLKRVLQTNQRNYRKDLPSFKPFMCLLGRGLVTAEDAAWRSGRKLLSAAMRIDILEDIPAIGFHAAWRLIAKLRAADAEHVEVGELYRALTLQVITQAVIGIDHVESDAVFPHLYLPIVEECNRQVWAPWRMYMPWLAGCRKSAANLVVMNKYIEGALRKRWALRRREAAQAGAAAAAARSQDILDRCMSQLTECGDDTVLQLRDDLKTMLLAGHETSSATLTWATLELLKNPTYADKVRAEFAEVFGHLKPGEIPPLETVKQLVWAPAVLRETLRLRSVLPLVMRNAAADDVVPKAVSGLDYDLTIPKGCSIMLGIATVHTRPDLWPDTDTFRPERFLDMDAVDPYAWIPFINGPRNCLGQHLSLIEMQIVLSFVFGTMPHIVAKDLGAADTEHEYELPACPENGLWLKFPQAA
jgi:cytochrome P450